MGSVRQKNVTRTSGHPLQPGWDGRSNGLKIRPGEHFLLHVPTNARSCTPETRILSKDRYSARTRGAGLTLTGPAMASYAKPC